MTTGTIRNPGNCTTKIADKLKVIRLGVLVVVDVVVDEMVPVLGVPDVLAVLGTVVDVTVDPVETVLAVLGVVVVVTVDAVETVLAVLEVVVDVTVDAVETVLAV